MQDVLFFVWGAVMGSAANALIDRLPREESWISGKSHCDRCKHELMGQDLMPIISYLLCLGRCRYCHSPIPFRNLLVEVGLGLAFVGLGRLYGVSLEAAAMCLIAMVTLCIAVMDWETKMVSEVLVAVWAIIIVVMMGISAEGILGAFAGLVIVGGVWLFSRGKAMGFGDVEIAIVMGLWLGWQQVLIALWIAFVSGAIAGGGKMLFKKAKLKSEMAFGPYLIFGTWMALWFGEKISPWIFLV